MAVAVMWSVGLWAVGIEYWLVFGVIGGAVEIVPYYGPILGMIPPLLMSLTQGAAAVAAVSVIYVIIHIVDSYVLLPWLMDREVDVPPAVVLIAILALGSAIGVWGIVLAMPVVTIGYVFVNRVYLRPEQFRSHVEPQPPVVPPDAAPGPPPSSRP